MMPTFIAPSEFSGQAELTASTGLTVISPGQWKFSQAGYNDGATFGLSLNWPIRDVVTAPKAPIDGGLLHLRAQNWSIPDGSFLTAWTDPDSGITYSANQCQIIITGSWSVRRQVNSNSYNSFGVERGGRTQTDLGSRDMIPSLLSYLSPRATYVIQGSAVTGGAQNTFESHVFECRITEFANTDNSNYMFQSNTIVTPVWIYAYTRRWQIDI